MGTKRQAIVVDHAKALNEQHGSWEPSSRDSDMLMVGTRVGTIAFDK